MVTSVPTLAGKKRRPTADRQVIRASHKSNLNEPNLTECSPPHRNVIHASDTNVSAENEINLWFKPEELVTWSRLSDLWIYKDYLQRMDNN